MYIRAFSGCCTSCKKKNMSCIFLNSGTLIVILPHRTLFHFMCVPIRPATLALGRQSCWIACRLICVSGRDENERKWRFLVCAGGMGDEDEDQPENDLVWQKYFLRPLQAIVQFFLLKQIFARKIFSNAVLFSLQYHIQCIFIHENTLILSHIFFAWRWKKILIGEYFVLKKL